MILKGRPAAAALAMAAGLLLAASPLGAVLDGLLADLLVVARHHLFPARSPQPSGEVVVVAIDERTMATAPFRDLPLVLWTPHHAQVLEALIAADARLVAYDLVFSASTEAALQGYDRAFRVALRQAATSDRLVLGEFRGSPGATPHASYVFSIGGSAHVRPVDIFPDRDGVVRALPLRVAADGGVTPSFTAEIASRLGSPVPDPPPDRLRLDLGAMRETVPVYSFAAVQACAVAGDRPALQNRFAGRTVLIGVNLGLEDRFLAGNRFLAPSAGGPAAVCGEAGGPTPPPARTMAGVLLLAAGVDQLHRGTYLREPSPTLAWTLILLATAAAALPMLLLEQRARAWLPAAALFPVIAGLALACFAAGLVLPQGRMLAGAGIAFVIAYLHRSGIIDRERWRLRRTLGLYLPGVELGRLQALDQLPALGGETRIVSVVFVDIANYTAIAERSTPPDITARLNDHFERLSVIVERHGGIVDRFVGDGILALFGAPLPHDDHADRAVRAAVEIAGDPPSASGDEARFAVRVAVTTGSVLVGNIGSRRRFNYSAIGDPINLASRLEGLNKLYGTTVLVDEATAARCGKAGFQEIDRVRVVGRAQAVGIYVPLAEARGDDPVLTAYAGALALYRDRQFAAAAACLLPLAEGYPVARELLRRCHDFARAAPPPDWDGTYVAQTK